MFDISTPAGVNAMFRSLLDMDIDIAGRRDMAYNFGKTFWIQLDDEAKHMWRWMFVIKTMPDDGPSDAEWLAGEAAYNWGMAKQDREMMSY